MSTKEDCKECSPLQKIRLPQNCRCPCCGNSKLMVIDSIINQPMSTDPSEGGNDRFGNAIGRTDNLRQLRLRAVFLF